jgi:MFS family permease
MDPGASRIRRFYLFRAVTSFTLWMPFWILWVDKNLESLFLITIVDSAFWITMILFQIPAGLLGDRYGRKAMLFIGEVLFAAGLLTFGLSTEFWQYLVSNVVWALGVCFIVSGDSPFVYDTLLELGRAKDYTMVMGKANAIMALVNAAACIFGGVIVENTGHAEYTLIIAAFVATLGSFTVIQLREPRVERKMTETYRAHLRTGLRIVLSTKAILIIILFQIVVEIGIYVMAVFRPVYLYTYLSLGYLQIGIFYASFLLVGAMATWNSGRIERTLREKWSLAFMYTAMFGSFVIVFLVQSVAAVSTQYLIYIVSGIQGPILFGYINKRVDSAHRSTVIAIATFMFTFILTAVEVASGYIATAWGLTESLVVLAITSAPIAVLLMVLWNRAIDAERSIESQGTQNQPM